MNMRSTEDRAPLLSLRPTQEKYDAPINGVKVPTRVWSGFTAGGVPVEAYVLAVTPNTKDPALLEVYSAEMRAAGLGLARETFTIDLPPMAPPPPARPDWLFNGIEFMKLPEITEMCALWREDDWPHEVRVSGVTWEVGQHKGVVVRRRSLR